MSTFRRWWFEMNLSPFWWGLGLDVWIHVKGYVVLCMSKGRRLNKPCMKVKKIVKPRAFIKFMSWNKKINYLHLIILCFVFIQAQLLKDGSGMLSFCSWVSCLLKWISFLQWFLLLRGFSPSWILQLFCSAVLFKNFTTMLKEKKTNL